MCSTGGAIARAGSLAFPFQSKRKHFQIYYSTCIPSSGGRNGGTESCPTAPVRVDRVVGDRRAAAAKIHQPDAEVVAVALAPRSPETGVRYGLNVGGGRRPRAGDRRHQRQGPDRDRVWGPGPAADRGAHGGDDRPWRTRGLPSLPWALLPNGHVVR
jgi:hypothetical protein